MSETTADQDCLAIAPYSGDAYRFALQRVLGHPMVSEILRHYFPQYNAEALAGMGKNLANADQLQKAFVDPFIQALLDKTSAGLTIGGVDRLRQGETYLFLCNHREIVLDPGLFCWALFKNGLRTPEICLGDNLLGEEWVMHLMKLNKGITVKRSASSRELLRWSQALSGYIRQRIASGAESVWLAQREGRAKDGDDRTAPGVLKMLSLSGEGSFVEKMSSLRLRPIAISYEYLPCDVLLARELYLTARDGSYQKHEREDAESMRRSFGGWKGGIRIEVGHPIDGILDQLAGLPNRNEQTRALATAIDDEIHQLYHLWPTNYIASDSLAGKLEPDNGRYTAEQAAKFHERLEKRLTEVKPASSEEADGIRQCLLRLYARPVLNRRDCGALSTKNE